MDLIWIMIMKNQSHLSNSDDKGQVIITITTSNMVDHPPAANNKKKHIKKCC